MRKREIKSKVVDIEKLYRRLHHATARVTKDEQRSFVIASFIDAYNTFDRVVGLAGRELGEIEVYFGRCKKAYYAPIDRVMPPPYYLWCRCRIGVETNAIKNSREVARLKRNQKGLLPFTLI